MGAGARRVVGIDLGTTHTVLAWAERRGDASVHVQPLAQLVATGEVEAHRLLPSCLYAPPEGQTEFDPWGDAPWVVGELARRRGAEVPGRFVASAKSWLSHAGVNRTAAILPWAWDEDEGVPRLSPVDASARLLSHVRRAYNDAFPDAPLEEQEVILTVPASFDEVARELTLLAAERAGLSVKLLEEPQAAFYDYMVRAESAGIEALLARAGGDALVLVCDVGGGTTDLSLIKVTRPSQGDFAITRVAVGRHVLLGGDNMDLALAHSCEARLVAAPERLGPARFAQLVMACRGAKERLLGDNPPDAVPATLLGAGAKLVGTALSTHVTRQEAEQIVLEGFWPRIARDARPQQLRSALVAFGLPYERDVAITRHVASFFAKHSNDSAGPDALLLNGGVFRAPRIAQRLVETIEGWGGSPLYCLPLADPDLAVARGAVAYGLALNGYGRRIQGGAARGYYIGLGRRPSGPRAAVCIVPRGAEEGVVHVVRSPSLALTIGRPVRFDLFASDDAIGHGPGDIVAIDDEHFEPQPPVAVAFDAGERISLETRVFLEGELTAVGTLELGCIEAEPRPQAAPRRFRLAFQLRDAAASPSVGLTPPPPLGLTPPPRPPGLTPPPPLVSRAGAMPIWGAPGEKLLDQATAAIERVFGRGAVEASLREIKDLLRELERLLGERPGWTLATVRTIYDALWEGRSSRRRTADHERMFWMLAGYCIRPGFGATGDDRRVARLTPLFGERVAFSEVRVWQQFWIAWRRVAGGVGEPTQVAMRDTVDPFIAPTERGLKKPKKWKPEAEADLLDFASSLERVPPARRSELGGWVLERTWTHRDPRLWAAIGRIGARVPTYASVHHVVPPSVAERWLDHLFREKWDQLPTAAQAAVALARVTDDRARDLSEPVRREVERRLVAVGARPEWVRAVREHVMTTEAERVTFYGERLPIGLRLLEP